MKNIGVLVAVEINAVLEKYKDSLREEKHGLFSVYILQRENATLYFIHSGAGEIRAAAAVQHLIDTYKIELLINFGVVGALTKDFASVQTCFVSRVVHYDFDTSAADNCEVGRYNDYPEVFLYSSKDILKQASALYPEIPLVTIASGDKFIADEAQKEKLHKDFSADICDMESAAVVLVCDINKIANLLIKTVADSVTGGAKEFREQFREGAEIALNVADNVCNHLELL